MQMEGGSGMKLEAECGATTVSLTNAVKLLPHNGKPDRIVLRMTDVLRYEVDAEWYVPGDFSMRWHTFTGFSWGFRGTGPLGLQGFLSMADLPLRMDVIEAIPHRSPGEVAWFNRRINRWSQEIQARSI